MLVPPSLQTQLSYSPTGGTSCPTTCSEARALATVLLPASTTPRGCLKQFHSGEETADCASLKTGARLADRLVSFVKALVAAFPSWNHPMEHACLVDCSMLVSLPECSMLNLHVCMSIVTAPFSVLFSRLPFTEPPNLDHMSWFAGAMLVCC